MSSLLCEFSISPKIIYCSNGKIYQREDNKFEIDRLTYETSSFFDENRDSGKEVFVTGGSENRSQSSQSKKNSGASSK